MKTPEEIAAEKQAAEEAVVAKAKAAEEAAAAKAKAAEDKAAAKAKAAEDKAAAKALSAGPVAKTNIKLRGKTYDVGKPLPDDLTDDEYDELELLGAI